MPIEKEILKKSLYLNRKKLKILASLLTLSIISGINLRKEIDHSIDKQYIESIMKVYDEINASTNDDFLNKYQEDNIILANFKSNVEKKYKIQNNQIIDNNGNTLDITSTKQNIYFYSCNISEELLKNIRLKDTKIISLGFNGSSVSNYVIDYLPTTLRYISFKKCPYITDLSKLPKQCPNLEVIDLNLMPSLTDLSFLYKLPNLKKIELAESAYIDLDLLNYFYSKGISTNLDIEDYFNKLRIDSIINNIIKPGMSDEEKVRAITLYVINQMNYNLSSSTESNNKPLTLSLKEGKGVCAGYAYLTNILLNKAGITSYKILNEDHTWNLIKLNNNFYYLDTTNINKKELYQIILKYFGLAKNYMIDTYATNNTSMTNPDNSKTIIPIEFIEDIANNHSDKSLIEKYGPKLVNELYYIGSILAGIFAYLGIIPIVATGIIAIDTYLNIKDDYYEEVAEAFIKNLE